MMSEVLRSLTKNDVMMEFLMLGSLGLYYNLAVGWVGT